MDDKLKLIIKEMYKSHAEMAEEIKDLSVKYNLTNTQEFINWQDKLNEISIL